MVKDILFLIGLDWGTLGIVLVCALSATFILSNYAKPFGTLSYAINFLALFLGGAAACGALQKLGWTMEGQVERDLLACFSGMAVVSLAMMRWWPVGKGR